jgi:hypothetical protein
MVRAWHPCTGWQQLQHLCAVVCCRVLLLLLCCVRDGGFLFRQLLVPLLFEERFHSVCRSFSALSKNYRGTCVALPTTDDDDDDERQLIHFRPPVQLPARRRGRRRSSSRCQSSCWARTEPNSDSGGGERSTTSMRRAPLPFRVDDAPDRSLLSISVDESGGIIETRTRLNGLAVLSRL